MIRTRIKICGIRTVADALYAEKLGVDTIGLVFYEKSPRYVSVEQAQEISFAVGGMMGLVALFYNAPESQVRHVIRVIPQVLLQFHGDESVAYCEQFARPYMKAFAMERSDTLDVSMIEKYTHASAILLDSNTQGEMGGTGHVFDWRKIPTDMKKPLILAGGLSVDNAVAAIEQIHPYAVDVSSGVESKRGLKSHTLMRNFVEKVRGIDCDKF